MAEASFLTVAEPDLSQSTETCEAAHQLLNLGLPITLCRSGTKIPISKGWPTKTWTYDRIDAAFVKYGDLEVGLVLGALSGLIDIELDGPGGDAALMDLFDGDVPVTPLWNSARGAHRLFQWHDDLDRIGKSSILMGPIEIRLGASGRAAYSLVPPSTTDGVRRQWMVSLDECSPAPLPPAVLRRILETFGGGTGDCVEGGCAEGPARMVRARLLLAHA